MISYEKIINKIKNILALITIIIFFLFSGCKDKVTDAGSIEEECPGPIGQWQLLGLENETIISIAVHPHDERIIYAGSQYDFSAGHMGKLFKSTNCGKTWDTLMVGTPLFSFRDIVIDPLHPETVYTIPLPILKSTDGGLTWFQITNGIRINWETRVSSFIIDPNDPTILYAGTGGFFGGTLYKSTDAGMNWRNLYRSEEETPGLRDGVISLAIDPKNTHVIYAGTAFSGRVLKSTDAGDTWHVTGLGVTNQLVDMIKISPIHNNIVYAGIRFKGLYKSENYGEQWNKEDLIDTIDGYLDLSINPLNESIIYLATSSGAYTKVHNQWINISNRLPHGYLNVIRIAPYSRIVYSGLKKIWEKNNGGIYARRY